MGKLPHKWQDLHLLLLLLLLLLYMVCSWKACRSAQNAVQLLQLGSSSRGVREGGGWGSTISPMPTTSKTTATMQSMPIISKGPAPCALSVAHGKVSV